MNHVDGPITRQGLHPVVGHYGFLDPALKDCRFALKPSADGIAGGALATYNCESAPWLARAVRWESERAGHFRLRSAPGRYSGIWTTVGKPIAEHSDEAEQTELGTRYAGWFGGLQKFAIFRLDAPNLRRPARLAAGWWSFSTTGQTQGPYMRLALMLNGRIGDASQCPGGGIRNFAGGRWKADEGGVTLFTTAAKRWGIGPSMRFDGIGKTLTGSRGAVTMVHD